ALIIADGLRAPVMLLVPLLHWAGLLSYPLLVIFAAVIGTLSTPYASAQRVIVPELLGEDEGAVSQANALFQGATRATFLLGPPVAGVLISVIGAPAVLVIDAATFAVAFVLIALFVPHVGRATGDGDQPDVGGLLAGIRYLRGDRLLSTWTLAITGGDAAWIVIFVGTPVLVVAHYGGQPELAGLIMGGFGAGALIGNALSYRFFGAGMPGPGIAAGALVQALPLWLLAMDVPDFALVAALVVSGIGNGLVNPTVHAMITLRPPPAIRAKVLAAVVTASVAGGPLAVMGGGFRAPRAGRAAGPEGRRARFRGIRQPGRDGGGRRRPAAGDADRGRIRTDAVEGCRAGRRGRSVNREPLGDLLGAAPRAEHAGHG